MKKNAVKVGGEYIVKVSGRLAAIQQASIKEPPQAERGRAVVIAGVLLARFRTSAAKRLGHRKSAGRNS
jgi:hypothetical protein